MPLDDHKATGPDQAVEVTQTPVIRVRLQQRIGDGGRVLDFETWVPSDSAMATKHKLIEDLGLLADRQVEMDHLCDLERNVKAGEAKGDQVGDLQRGEMAKLEHDLVEARARYTDVVAAEQADHEMRGKRGDWKPSNRAEKLADVIAEIEKKIVDIKTDLSTARATHEKNLAAAREKLAAQQQLVARLAE